MDEEQMLAEFRFHLNRLEIALDYTYPAEREPLVKGICERLRGLLDEIEDAVSAGRTKVS